MLRDAEATRRRLVEAARAEFAAYGIAGARVDRIAATAGSNKAQIYHYFGSKDQLFDAAFTTVVEQVVQDIPIDVADLPGYAARLAEAYGRHPDIMRLATWQRLERAGDPPLPVAAESNRRKIAEIAEAQRRGRITTRYPPETVLSLVLHLAAYWGSLTPELLASAPPSDGDERYDLVADVVRRMLAP